VEAAASRLLAGGQSEADGLGRDLRGGSRLPATNLEQPPSDDWENVVRKRLEVVRWHHKRGEIDAAWRCFTAATRREIEVADATELIMRAKALRNEAKSDKLSGWRSKTILDLLDAAEIEQRLPTGSQAPSEETLREVRARVAWATRHRDDDDNNRYYKVALVRDQRSLLLVVLVVCIVLILALVAAVDWDSDLSDPSVGFAALVAMFGSVGACLSAIRSLGRQSAGSRIPEHVASSLITIARPALGAAAALGVYVIAVSGAFNIDFSEEEAHLTLLGLGFAAGFSERLVVSAVGAATGGQSRGSDST
jgi:hypothetical protein